MLTVITKQKDIARRIAAVQALGQVDCPKCGAPYLRPRSARPYFVCACCRHRWSENPVVDALGSWLSELHETYPWDWFATLTFANERRRRSGQGEIIVSRGDVTPDSAQYWFRRFLEDAGSAGLAKPYAFRADEYGPLYGRYHLHALVGNVGHLRRYCGTSLPKDAWGKSCCWVHRWPCGYARIYAYDPQRGAHYYLSKYVAKALANWELIGFEPQDLVFPDRVTKDPR